MLKPLVLVALLGAIPAVSAAAAEPDSYLSDILVRQPYRSALMGLLAGKTLAPWVRDFLKVGNGVEMPAKTVDVAGTTYRIDRLCKPHDCDRHVFVVIWAPTGRKAWAALGDAPEPPRLFGDPPPDLAKILIAAAKP